MEINRIVRLSTLLALCLGATFAAAQAQQAKPAPPPVTLHVGDPAPAISVMKWVKGEPVNLKDGKVHVVEFWATWCGPCKIGMPHLSELANEYKGKVVFSGISVWEANAMKDKAADTMPKVESFVNHAHGMMDYNVAADGSAAVMAQTWMTAAGQHGIPAAFIVDQEGKIAWIGHPLLGLGEVLPLVVDHKFDKAAADKVAADWKTKMDRGQETFKQLQEAQKAGDNAKVVTLCDQVLSDLPYMVGFCAPTKYAALTHTSPSGASQYVEDLLRTQGNAPLVLSGVAGAIADEKAQIAGKRDYALATRLMKQAESCFDPDYSFSQTYASVCSKAGDAASAVKWQAQALQAAQSAGYPQKILDEAQKKLDEYKAALQQKG